MEYQEALDWLSEKVAGYKEERPLIFRKHLLVGLIASASALTEELRRDVLDRVTREVVVDADANIDYGEAAVKVLDLQLTMLPEDSQATAAVSEVEGMPDAGGTDIFDLFSTAVDSMTIQQLINRWNVVLKKMTDVLYQIADMLEHPRKNDDYAAMYNNLKNQFYVSSTGRRARKNFDKWKINDCDGKPTLEDIEDYRIGKLEHLFGTGIFDVQVARRQHFKKYPGEIDFDQMDDAHELKQVMHKHYAEMRRMVDFVDGNLEPIPARVGRFFYENRKSKNAKAHRNSFLKYMLKISLAQEERRRLLEQQAQAETVQATALNTFAPAKHLKELLKGEWFSELRSDKKYDGKWTDAFVSALMASEWHEEIAQEWSAKGVRNKRMQIKGYIVGLLKDAGVVKGSYDSIARSVAVTDDFRVFSRYMGKGKKQTYAKWVEGYVHRG